MPVFKFTYACQFVAIPSSPLELIIKIIDFSKQYYIHQSQQYGINNNLFYVWNNNSRRCKTYKFELLVHHTDSLKNTDITL